ncbi:MAG: hypothetical protein K0Q51_1450 [Rickettsiaceae bacterium]|jgi:hypothetical protein|nr:hypothetical protein [Rickettsiaceae bacterium]
MKSISFNGNFVDKVDDILRNQLKAVKTDFFSNNIDEGFHIYQVKEGLKDIEVEVHLKEDGLLGDITTISSSDTFLKQINNLIGSEK